MKESIFASLIKEKYGAVRRARGPFLYTASGKRLLDMYLEGGRAILGWRGGKGYTVFKNVLSRGAIGSFYTGEEDSIVQAVNMLFENSATEKRKVIIFRDKSTALRTAYTLSKDSTMFWRPWGGTKGDREDALYMKAASNADCIVFVPPFPWGEALYMLAVKERVEGADSIESTFIPSPLASSIVRSIYDLKAQLPLRGEKDWFSYDKVLCRFFVRQGPYLFPSIGENGERGEERYDDFITACLECGIVISPSYSVPSIIFPATDEGVFKKLATLHFQ